MPRFGFGVRFRAQLLAGAPLYSAEASAYFAAMGVQPDDTRKGLIDNLIVSLKNAGVWAQLSWLALHASHSQQSGRINLKNPAQIATAVNSPTFTVDRGFTGDGATSYLNSGWNPATHGGGVYTQNDAHVGVWVGTVSGGNKIDVGVRDVTSIRVNVFGSTGNMCGNSTTISNYASSGNAAQWVGWTRNDGTVMYPFRNGARQASTASTTSALVGNNFGICSGISTANVMSQPSNHRVQATHWGANLTEAQITALYTALNTYMTAIGAA